MRVWLAAASAIACFGTAPAWSQTVSAASPESGAEDDTAVEAVVVTGRRIEDYSATDALTGTKSNALLKDLPLSVGVVPLELIEDRSLTFLGEALDNVSGAQRKLGYGGTQNFGAFLRGFDQGFLTLRNGIRDFGFYTLRDTANVERFEVLKGTSSVLYGAVNPGGITNTITKKPVSDPLLRVQGIVGSYDRYRTELDIGGPLSETVSYRANFALEDAESFRDFVQNQSQFFAPVVAWEVTDRTSLTLEAEYKHSEFTWDLGLPRNPAIFMVPVERFLGEPDSVNDVSSLFASTTLLHELSDAWRLRQVLGYVRTEGDYELRSGAFVRADGRTVNRGAFDTREESDVVSVQHELLGDLRAFNLGHQLVVGAEYYRTAQNYDFILRPITPIDLFNPVYGAPLGAGSPFFADKITSQAYAVYGQNLISLGERWKLLIGARYDQVESETYDRLRGRLVRTSTDEAFSPQVGVVYQPHPATSLYASYGESFVPVTSGRTATGDFLDPEGGEQIEVGAKQELLGGRARASLALYKITKTNVSTPDPDNVLFRVQTGEQTSEGVEFDLSGSLLPGWDTILTASYIDAVVSRDNRFQVGSRLPGAAEKIASLWNKYTFGDGPVAGLSLGFGVYYVDERQAALPNGLILPGYTRLDALAAYDFGKVALQFNVKNLADETIYDLTSTTIFPQEPRSFTLRVAYAY